MPATHDTAAASPAIAGATPRERGPVPAMSHHELAPAEQRLLVLWVAGAHLLLAWGLMQLDGVRSTVQTAAPMFFSLVAAPVPLPVAPRPPPAKAPPAPTARMAPRHTPAPRLAAAPTPAPAAPAFVAPPPEPLSTPVVAALPTPTLAPPTPPAPPAPAAPPAPPPPPPRLIPASAVRYRVPPPIAVPLASRRLGEAGTVHLRVLVDAAGLPRQITLQRSSGFERLDAQAIEAMHLARFQPQTEHGVPIEWIVIAPLQYELE